jgi:hypothetical protein
MPAHRSGETPRASAELPPAALGLAHGLERQPALAPQAIAPTNKSVIHGRDLVPRFISVSSIDPEGASDPLIRSPVLRPWNRPYPARP